MRSREYFDIKGGGKNHKSTSLFRGRSFGWLNWQTTIMANKIPPLAILIFGFFFNSISIYDPATNNTINTHTYIPLIAGIVLFSVGTTIARYDEIHKEFVDLSPAEDERGKAEKSIMGFSPMTQKLILESQANH
jgi:hypothetical protein